MGLFGRLLRLHALYPGVVPEEDFFTEVLSHLFRTPPETLCAWLKHLNLLETCDGAEVYVSTQSSFDPLPHHELGSRFDFLVELIDGDECNRIVIESKVGSSENETQLQRYAEILNSQTDPCLKILLYITRDYDPKDERIIFKRIPGTTVRFRQVRWYHFYNFLRTRPATPLIDEVLYFMEERRMAQSNQFSTLDILTLTNFAQTFSLLDETLFGEVEAKLQQVLGRIDRGHRSRFEGLRTLRRYLLHAWLNDGFWCGLDYVIPRLDVGGYPYLRLMLEIAPKSAKRAYTVQALREIADTYPGWVGYNLNTADHWAGIRNDTTLRNFLAEEDHISAVRSHFGKLLDELAEIKATYPLLPWLEA